MDKPIQKKKKLPQKLLWTIFALGTIGITAWIILNSSKNSIYYPKNQVIIEQVITDDFTEIITTNGTVIPHKTVQVDAFEGGVVDQIYAENGSWVKKGQPLIQLSNTALSLDFMNRETQIVEQINNLRNTRILLDQNKRNIQEQLLDVGYNYLQQQEQFARDSNLYSEKVISDAEYQTSLNNRNYLHQKLQMLEERTVTDEKYRSSQLHRIDNSIQLMERNLSAVRKSLNELTIISPMDGQLNSFQHELGATLVRGENIGRIDVVDSFYMTAMIDQYYLQRIKVGQESKIKIGSTSLPLAVAKVNPTVTNNQFEVHFAFTDNMPSSLRRGQNAPIKIALSQQNTATLIPKGAFYSSSGGKFVYVVKNDIAYKTPVSLGRQNDTHIEVLSGVSAGDKVITSPYTNFNSSEQIILKNS